MEEERPTWQKAGETGKLVSETSWCPGLHHSKTSFKSHPLEIGGHWQVPALTEGSRAVLPERPELKSPHPNTIPALANPRMEYFNIFSLFFGQKTLNKDKSPGREHIKLLIAILAFYWFYFIGFIPAMAIPMRIGKEECCCLASSAVSDSFVTPWTIACQAPLTMGFPRWEYWSGLPFLSPGDVAYPREIEPTSPALQADSFPLSQWGSQNKG